MNCQRYKPAEFNYITPTAEQKKVLAKGVPQVDMSMLQVSDSFHLPPASALSEEVFVTYPFNDNPIPDIKPRFFRVHQSADVKPHNFECNYQDISHANAQKHKDIKTPVPSTKHPGQRMLG